jgi:nucleoside-diphosphate-sugar epimerase
MSFSKNIVGKGFIAKNLFKIKKKIFYSGYIVYAAGISNSNTKSKTQLLREIKSFKSFSEINSSKKIIYISTADITNNLKNKSRYVKNKLKIEKMIKKLFKNYVILRLPQIIGKSNNKNTLINYFYYRIKKNKKIKLITNVKRNILDIDDVVKMIKIIIMNKKITNKIITLSNKYSSKPIEIIKILEKKLGKKGNIVFKKSLKENWRLNFSKNIIYFNKANIHFDSNYLVKAIDKYY